MKPHAPQAGFSLIEINMAVFVMAIGVLSMVVLYPLGLRESSQGTADLKQAMFADYVLNQAVALASQTNLTWSQWKSVPRVSGTRINMANSVPGFIRSKIDLGDWPDMVENTHYKIACCLVPGASDRVMGILVQSSDLTKNVLSYDQFTNNPIFYAEAMFQGDPMR